MKTCNKCLEIKPESDFYFNKNHGKLEHVCRSCRSKRVKEYQIAHPEKRKKWASKYYRKHPYKNKIHTLKSKFKEWKHNAKKRNIEWCISFEQIENIPLKCFYSGVDLTLQTNQSNSISIERLNSDIGYLPKNVVFCCAEINIMKNDMDRNHFINLCGIISNHINNI